MRRTSRRHAARRSAVLAALALLAAPLSAAHADPAAPTSVLTGVVTLNGEPVSGATVTVTPLPGLNAPTGPYRQQSMASGSTSSTGRFSIPLSVDPTIVDMGTLNGGYVNFWVQAFYNTVKPASTISVPSNIVWGGEGTAYSAADLAYSTLVDTGATGPVDSTVGTVLSTPDAVTLELTTYEEADTAQMTGTGLAGNVLAGSASGDGSSCESTYAPLVTVEGRENDPNPVGEAHVMYDSTADFSYGATANTDLNGAYSMNKGPFKATAGMNHIGNTESKIVKTYTAHQAYELLTSFRYRKERLDFTDDMGDGHVCRSDYRIVPEGWVGGGAAFGADVSSHDSAGQMDAARGKGWAVDFTPKTQYFKSTSKGKKYTAEVAAFGVKLAAQSTWSTKVELHWTFGANGDHWLYGSNGTLDDAENIYAW